MTRILVTGFEPFHQASQNPSQALIEAIAREGNTDIETLLLPVLFTQAPQIAIEKIEKWKPDAVVALGQAEGRTHITPEKIAINLDDARIEDNQGNQPSQRSIHQGGADGLFSTLPIERMVEAIKAVDVPAALSLSAGTFVCNHLFYHLQSYCKERGIRSGFVHVPLMESQAAEFPNLPTMKFEEMLKGIKAALSVL